jgi:hypothetical protein
MKRIIGFAIVLGTLCLPAFAAKNSKTVDIGETVMVGSKKLPAGNYKVSWTGTGSNLQVTIAQHGKESVTVPAKMVNANNDEVGIVTDKAGGANVLQSIQFDHFTLNLKTTAS